MVGTQARQHLRGRGKRERQAECERRFPGEAGRREDQPGEREAGDGDLGEAEPENVALQPPQPRRMELEPDQEEQQHDAEIGDVEHLFRCVDEAEPLRPDQGAGDEIAEHRAEPEFAEQHDERHRRAEHDDAVAKDEGGGGGGGAFHQPARARPAASAAASKASRIEGWRAL